MPVVVLISGSGSNLQAIIDGQKAGALPIDIRAVFSNRADAYGLTRARNAGIEAGALSHRDFTSRDDYDRQLIALIDAHRPKLVILAGFMRILSQQFVEHYQGRLINIHPSLLPAFRGLQTHERALASGVKEHGCSVHFVTPELDAGPVIVQARVPIIKGDTPETLAARVQIQEHRIYPLAVKWIAEGRVEMRVDGVYRDGVRQESPPVLEPEAMVEDC
ncbi:MAG TPA: phosphoribosylglycinamide formyltransferase [Gammaproteobacteria bacterium]|nr:phosphoribosylglycinamide formyltransferase [Gammaproteobacteria bacterium]